MTETINGLHSCKPNHQPIEGDIKTFVVEQRQGKSGKPYLKIKSEKEEYGGRPFKIISAKKTDFVDAHGNLSFNLELEPAAQQGESVADIMDGVRPEHTKNVKGDDRFAMVDDINETRRHLMKSANLLVLCIAAVEKAVAPHQPVVAQTSEQFQSDVAKLFIEASSRRTTDGVHWWSYIDKMPTHPIKE